MLLGCVILIKKKEETTVRLFQKIKAPQYDAERYQPAIKKSICTGEATAGFLERDTGKFTEIMLIRTEKDLDAFKKEYSVEEPLRTIY